MKPFARLAVLLLALIAALQATRFVAGWSVAIEGHVVPAWVSGVLALLAGGVAALLWRESRT